MWVADGGGDCEVWVYVLFEVKGGFEEIVNGESSENWKEPPL